MSYRTTVIRLTSYKLLLGLFMVLLVEREDCERAQKRGWLGTKSMQNTRRCNYRMSWVFSSFFFSSGLSLSLTDTNVFLIIIIIIIGNRYIEVAPEDVIWANLGMNPYEQKVHTLHLWIVVIHIHNSMDVGWTCHCPSLMIPPTLGWLWSVTLASTCSLYKTSSPLLIIFSCDV